MKMRKSITEKRRGDGGDDRKEESESKRREESEEGLWRAGSRRPRGDVSLLN